MPTLTCIRSYLFELLGKTFSDVEFADICFRFGVELDEITTPEEMKAKEMGEKIARTSDFSAENNDIIFKIDCPANRHDLLSVEGMAVALKVFLGLIPTPCHRLIRPSSLVTVHVMRSVKHVREFISCAILRELNFTTTSLASFIDFQDKLHQSLARRRSLASVGTHDLSKIRPPFFYDAQPRNVIQFVPLKQSTTLSCAENGLAEYYKDDKFISKYVSLLSPFPNYPIVRDSVPKVLSLPPIINSAYSAISLSTRDVFIECTGVDKKKTDNLLQLLVASFSMYCKDPFTIEPVELKYEDGRKSELTPSLGSRSMTCSTSRLATQIGLFHEELTPSICASLLRKMQIEADPSSNDDLLEVQVPIQRPDILHECDIMEDVAIAFGYDKLVQRDPIVPTLSSGTQNRLEKLSHLLRLEIATCGYSEILTTSLCSRDETSRMLRRKEDNSAVQIANPKTHDYQICRTSLLPGTLRFLMHNLHHALPIQLFEVTDVVLKDVTARTGARNKRHVAALCCTADRSAFHCLRGVLEHIMEKLEVPKLNVVKSDDQDFFLPGRGADIVINTRKDSSMQNIGCIGVLHPEVLSNFDISYPVTYMEFTIEPFVSDSGVSENEITEN